MRLNFSIFWTDEQNLSRVSAMITPNLSFHINICRLYFAIFWTAEQNLSSVSAMITPKIFSGTFFYHFIWSILGSILPFSDGWAKSQQSVSSDDPKNLLRKFHLSFHIIICRLYFVIFWTAEQNLSRVSAVVTQKIYSVRRI